MAQIKKERQRLVLCRLMVDIMRTVHSAYAPVSEPFGTRIETFFIAVCVAIGDMDGRPFSVAKIATYMRVPRTTVIRRLDLLQSWGLIDRRGRFLEAVEGVTEMKKLVLILALACAFTQTTAYADATRKNVIPINGRRS